MSLLQNEAASHAETVSCKKSRQHPDRNLIHHKIWVPTASGIPLLWRARHPQPESTRCAKSVDFSFRWLTALLYVPEIFLQVHFKLVFSFLESLDILLETYADDRFAEGHHGKHVRCGSARVAFVVRCKAVVDGFRRKTVQLLLLFSSSSEVVQMPCYL